MDVATTSTAGWICKSAVPTSSQQYQCSEGITICDKELDYIHHHTSHNGSYLYIYSLQQQLWQFVEHKTTFLLTC